MSILSQLAKRWGEFGQLDERGLFDEDQPPIPETAHWFRDARDCRMRQGAPPPLVDMGYREIAARRADQDAQSAAYNLVAIPF